MKKFLYRLFLLVFACFLNGCSFFFVTTTTVHVPEPPKAGNYPSVEDWNDAGYAQANTAKDAAYLSADEKELIRLTNLMRMNPVYFEKTFLNEYLRDNRDDESFVKSLRSDLKKQKPLPLLFPDKNLCRAATFHAEDMGKTGKLGHSSSNRQGMKARLEKFGTRNCFIAENCSYGYDTPLKILCSLLVDSGVPSLGHRKNLLSNDFDKVGMSIKPHKSYRINAVQDFAGRCLSKK
jgi:uncharacterized protein YkwD